LGHPETRTPTVPEEEVKQDFTIPLTEGIEAYRAAATDAMRKLREDGLDVAPPRPRVADGSFFDGRLPSNVNSLSNTELGDIYGLMNSWTTYVSDKFIVAKAELLNADTQLDLAKARIRKSKTGTVQDKADATICDSRYVNINRAYLTASHYTAILKNIVAAAERDLKVISRLIEVKKLQFEQNRRGGSISSTPRPAPRSRRGAPGKR